MRGSDCQYAALRRVRRDTITFHSLACALTQLRCRYSAKFSVRPPHENVDVNLTVAWWGNARGNAV